jgi:hypothetical protein
MDENTQGAEAVRRTLMIAMGVIVAGGIWLVPTPASAAAAEDCAAYVDLCDEFPGSTDRDCGEIGHPVTLITPGVDPWGLDRDRDGTGCEDGTGGGTSSPTAKPTKTATAKPTKKPSASPSRSSVAAGGNGSAGSGGPALPVTGAKPIAAAGIGVGVVVVGVALSVVARKRRTRFVSR